METNQLSLRRLILRSVLAMFLGMFSGSVSNQVTATPAVVTEFTESVEVKKDLAIVSKEVTKEQAIINVDGAIIRPKKVYASAWLCDEYQKGIYEDATRFDALVINLRHCTQGYLRDIRPPRGGGTDTG
jgi:hypothetical protein